ncbi:MAG: RNA polymerase sigma factor [bacterium]|nr:RNA polymerase sigma factor [bacterium]
MNSPSDSALIASYRAGKASALEVLIRRHLSSVFHFLRGMVGDEAVSQDLTQDTFVKVWQHLWRFRLSRPFKPWLFTIAKRTALDYLRKKQPLTFSALQDPETDEPVEALIRDERPLISELLAQEDVAQAMRDLLMSLSPQARSVVLLHDEQSLTFQEISDLSKEPLNTVKSRYRRALLLLRERIEQAKNTKDALL